MAKKTAVKEEVKLEPSRSGFTLIGNVKLTDNTFPAESTSKGGFISRRLNLGVEVGEGKVSYAEMFGGFHRDKPRDIIAFQKASEGEEKGGRLEVAWEDRLSLDEATFATIADFSLLTVALEKDSSGKTFYKKFLSAFDAIMYMEEHLKDGMKIKVKGKLSPNYYNGKTTIRKEITYIGLAKEDELPSATGYINILVDKNSVGKSRIKQDDELDINGLMVAYASKVGDVEVKKNIPFPISLVLPLQSDVDDKVIKGKINRVLQMLAVKGNGVNEIGLDIEFEEGVLVRQATLEDLDKDSRQLVEDGIISLEDAVGKVSVSGGRMNRVIVRQPQVKREDVDGKPQIRLVNIENKYTLEDVSFSFEDVKPEVKEEVTEEQLDNYFADSTGGDTDTADLLSSLGIM